MTKPCHFTVYSFPVQEWVCKQTAHTSREHHCWSASTIRPDHELPLSVSCFFFLIHSFLIHPGTFPFTPWLFLKSLWWEMLSAGFRKYKLVISTGYPLSKGLLTPSESSRDYGRTSLYPQHITITFASNNSFLLLFFFFFSFLQSSSTAPTCPSASYAVEELIVHVKLKGWD